MSRIQASMIAIVLLAVAGGVHGMWTGRWVGGAERAEATQRLAAVPLHIGDWDGEDHEMEERARTVAGIDGYLMRHYTRRSTKESVSVLLVCGPPGPVSVHTPEVCYGGAGFTLTAPPARTDLALAGVPQAPFRTALFRKEGVAAPEQLRIFWSWYTGSRWATPDRPRWTFARCRYLYKLYVINPTPAADGPVEQDSAARFLRLLLPELEKDLLRRS
jgi:hypothetical protein